jgi:hypothetical protein
MKQTGTTKRWTAADGYGWGEGPEAKGRDPQGTPDGRRGGGGRRWGRTELEDWGGGAEGGKIEEENK